MKRFLYHLSWIFLLLHLPVWGTNTTLIVRPDVVQQDIPVLQLYSDGTINTGPEACTTVGVGGFAYLKLKLPPTQYYFTDETKEKLKLAGHEVVPYDLCVEGEECFDASGHRLHPYDYLNKDLYVMAQSIKNKRVFQWTTRHDRQGVVTMTFETDKLPGERICFKSKGFEDVPSVIERLGLNLVIPGGLGLVDLFTGGVVRNFAAPNAFGNLFHYTMLATEVHANAQGRQALEVIHNRSPASASLGQCLLNGGIFVSGAAMFGVPDVTNLNAITSYVTFSASNLLTETLDALDHNIVMPFVSEQIYPSEHGYRSLGSELVSEAVKGPGAVIGVYGLHKTKGSNELKYKLLEAFRAKLGIKSGIHTRKFLTKLHQMAGLTRREAMQAIEDGLLIVAIATNLGDDEKPQSELGEAVYMLYDEYIKQVVADNIQLLPYSPRNALSDPRAEYTWGDTILYTAEVMAVVGAVGFGAYYCVGPMLFGAIKATSALGWKGLTLTTVKGLFMGYTMYTAITHIASPGFATTADYLTEYSEPGSPIRYWSQRGQVVKITWELESEPSSQ